MSIFPLDIELILEQTLKNLPFNDLVACSLVNSQWNKTAENFLYSDTITVYLKSESAILRYLRFVQKGGRTHGRLAIDNLHSIYNPGVVVKAVQVLKYQIRILKTAFNIGSKNGRHCLNIVLNNVPVLEELGLHLFCGNKNDSITYISAVVPAELPLLRKLQLSINENVPGSGKGWIDSKMDQFLHNLAIATPILQTLLHSPRPDWNYRNDDGLIWLCKSRLGLNPPSIKEIEEMQLGVVHRWKEIKEFLPINLTSLSLLINGALAFSRMETENMLKMYCNSLKLLKLKMAGSAVEIPMLKLPAMRNLESLALHFDALPEKAHLLLVSLPGEEMKSGFPNLKKLEWTLYKWESLGEIINSFRGSCLLTVRDMKIGISSGKGIDWMEKIRSEQPNLFQALVNIIPCMRV